MRKNTLLYYLIFIGIVLFDTLSKFTSQNLSSFFINPVRNKGVVFGIFLGNIQIIVLSVVFLLILGYFLIRAKGTSKILIICLFSATFSNFLDRIVHGYVLDFIDLKIIPIFNFADAIVLISVIILFIITLNNDNNSKH